MRKLYFILFFLLSFNVLGQIRELNFNRLSVGNGLPANTATCFLQDRLGYMWFGTPNGLVRYDGYNLKVYNLETADKKEQANQLIITIFEDSKGILWISTYQQGLFRFNRSQDNFTYFPHPSFNKEPDKKDNTYFIAADKEGHIWTANYTDAKQNHLDRFHPGTGTFVSYDSLARGKYNLPMNAFIGILINDSKGRVWLGTDNGLYGYHAKRQSFNRFLASPDPANKQHIDFIYEAPSQPGLLWLIVRTKAGTQLVQFNPDTKKSKSYKSPVSGQGTEKMLTLFEDKARRLWVGTNKGILQFKPAAGTFTALKVNDTNREATADSCFDIKEGRNGALWVLSGKGLLHLASPSAVLRRFTADENKPGALPTDVLYYTYIDRNGGLWVGTNSFGIYRLNEKQSQFEFIQQTGSGTGYPGGYAFRIARLKNGKYLVSTSKGLFESDKNFTQFEPLNLLSGKQGVDILVDKKGIVWLGSENDGLFRYDPQTKKVINYRNNKNDSTSLSLNSITQIYEDSQDNLWVGTYGGGLCRLDRTSGKFTRYPYFIYTGKSAPHKGELDDAYIFSILEDSQGVLWVGTSNGGLNKFNSETGKFTSYYNSQKGLQCVISIFEDRQSRLWVGTYLWGLFLFDRQTGNYRRFTEKEGLVFNNVATIQEDKTGNLWLGGSRGYSIMNPNTFAIRQLTSENGLPTGELMYAATATAPNGDWLAGTDKGILRFNPNTLVSNPTLPVVILQTLQFSPRGKADARDSTLLLHNQQKVELSYNENRVTFQFAGIHFTNPALNTYRYRLTGYDEDWREGSSQRTVTYTNLAPGTYTFAVKAASAEGLWSQETATVSLIIHPPWWRTWWAYVLYVLLFALTVWRYVAYRSQTLRRENRLLEEKVNHRTGQLQKSLDDLKTTQTQLIQSEKMASLGELTAGIAHEIQNPLNFVNNFSEVSEELLQEMEEELQRGDTAEALAISSDVKENLRKIQHHGQRADSIVKNMLQHSRQNSGKKELTDLNALVDECLRLSYHGLRAKDKSFNAVMETSFDPAIAKIEMVPQDIGRVLVNLFNNAFYSVQQKKEKHRGSVCAYPVRNYPQNRKRHPDQGKR